jgi:quaternary ammonium compound-resistance protein SugE
MAWVYPIVAGLFEIGWPVGLKRLRTPGRLIVGVIVAVACITASGAFLWLAQRDIPIGTAYAVWTGIGAAGPSSSASWSMAIPPAPGGWSRSA